MSQPVLSAGMAEAVMGACLSTFPLRPSFVLSRDVVSSTLVLGDAEGRGK